jgi:hypothetical protein
MKFPPPTATVPALNNYEFGFNNLVFGGSTNYGLLNVEGLDLAKIASKNVQRNRTHGEVLGLDVFAGRDIVLDFWLQSDGVSLQDAQLNLASAFQIQPDTESYLWFQVGTLPVMCVPCRVEKRAVKIDSDYANANVAKPQITLHATDPRLYGQGVQTPLMLGASSSGLGPFPVGPFPVTFGSNSGSQIVIDNTGNMEMLPYIVFNGPLTSPFIQNATQSAIITLQNPAQTGYTVLAGDQATIDLDTHLVQYWSGGIANNQPSAIANWLVYPPTWWDLPPGGSLIQFGSADSTNTGGSVYIQWAPAYEL